MNLDYLEQLINSMEKAVLKIEELENSNNINEINKMKSIRPMKPCGSGASPNRSVRRAYTN